MVPRRALGGLISGLVKRGNEMWRHDCLPQPCGNRNNNGFRVVVSVVQPALPRSSRRVRLEHGETEVLALLPSRRVHYRRAIKALHTDGSESALARFEKEAQVQAELDHPHLLKVEHCDLDQDGRPYVVMPYKREKAKRTPHQRDRRRRP